MRPMADIAGANRPNRYPRQLNGRRRFCSRTGANQVEYAAITAKNREMNLTRDERTNGHNPSENDYDEACIVGRSRARLRCRRDARESAGSNLQPRLLRAVLSKRELPEQGSEQSLHRRLSAPPRNAKRAYCRREPVRHGRRILRQPQRPPHLLLLSSL